MTKNEEVTSALEVEAAEFKSRFNGVNFDGFLLLTEAELEKPKDELAALKKAKLAALQAVLREVTSMSARSEHPAHVYARELFEAWLQDSSNFIKGYSGDFVLESETKTGATIFVPIITLSGDGEHSTEEAVGIAAAAQKLSLVPDIKSAIIELTKGDLSAHLRVRPYGYTSMAYWNTAAGRVTQMTKEVSRVTDALTYLAGK